MMAFIAELSCVFWVAILLYTPYAHFLSGSVWHNWAGSFMILSLTSVLLFFKQPLRLQGLSLGKYSCVLCCLFLCCGIEYWYLAAGLFSCYFLFVFLPWEYWRVIITLLALIEASVGICQYFGIISHVPDFIVTGHFNNPAGFAAFLSAALPFALVQNVYSREKYFYFISSTIIIAAIFLSYSRSGILASSLICLLFVLKKSSKCFRFSTWMKFLVVILFTCGLVLMLYYLKQNSANGRLLIWQVSWEMIKEKPFLGHGLGSFQAHYMFYQADYLSNHLENKFVQLASDVKVPFNEYLKIWVEAGVVGVLFIVMLLCFTWKIFVKAKDEGKIMASLSIIAVSIFGFFSYPLSYFFVWLVIAFDLMLFCKDFSGEIEIRQSFKRLMKFVGGDVILGIALGMLESYKNETKSFRLAHTPIEDISANDYESLYTEMPDNYVVLYNYGAYLNGMGDYKRSIQIFNECSRWFNNSEMQLFLGDNYLNLKDYDQALKHIVMAEKMVHSRFTPLYYKFLVAREQGEEHEAIKIAQQIMRKEVKVDNQKLRLIKAEMNHFLNNHVGHSKK